MALIPCRECGREISTQAAACPQCGAPVAAPAEQQAPSMEEDFYEDERIRVTASRIVIGATTYALRNVTSVRLEASRPSSTGPTLGLVFGILLAAFGLNDSLTGFTRAVLAFGGIGMAGLCVKTLVRPMITYHVVLASASGEQEALSSMSHEYTGKIVDAINHAIAARS